MLGDEVKGLLKALAKQFGRYALVGTTAFIIDYATMVSLKELCGFPVMLATTIGFTVSVVFNYFASMRYVFTHRDELTRRREFIIFVVLALIGLGLNNLLMYVGVYILNIDYRIFKILATMMVALYNFSSRKYFLDAR